MLWFFQQTCMDVRVEPLNHKEGWAPKNWCFRAVVLEKIVESPLDSKEIKPVTTKGNQSWVCIGRIDVKVEVPILQPPDMKSCSLEKTLMLEMIEARRRGWQRMWSLDGITDLMDITFSKPWKMVKDREAWRTAVHGVAKSWTWFSD